MRKHIEKLISLYESEKAENDRLRRELSGRDELVLSLRKQLGELEQKIETQKLSAAFLPDGAGSAAAKEKLDKLIREIGRCIALLEK
ncbi:MAG: hypothetical protein IKR69_03465 [Bacteroidales bacterium]|nr:hypothetical protein [Bacteroidales bacterium]